MIADASKFNYRVATVDECQAMVARDKEDIEDLLGRAPVIMDNGILCAIVQGVAYPLQSLADMEEK